MGEKFKYVCFTAYVEPKWDDNMNYLIYQCEKCPTTGRVHYQGYVEFKSTWGIKKTKEYIGGEPHIEKRRGSQEEAINYCKKKESAIEGTLKEFGSPTKSNQGKRTDLQSIKEEVAKGTDLLTIQENYVHNNQNMRFMEGCVKYRRVPLECDVTVKWYWGPTGCGKTTKALIGITDPDNIYIHDSLSCKFWDGYYGQEYIILDEFRDHNWPLEYLLRLLDKWRIMVEIKGSKIWLANKRTFIITCPIPPQDCYKTLKNGDEDKITQLLRRINVIERVEGSNDNFAPEVKRGNTNPFDLNFDKINFVDKTL